jgi:group II intron reverse transcriptase/maturase
MDRLEGNMAKASNFEYLSPGLQSLAELARQAPQMGLTSLNHLLDLPLLYRAYGCTRKDGAPGVDGQTAAAYERDLLGNLQRLLDQAQTGTYRAPPVRRVYIPKGEHSTETRPIGIPTLEDKVLQRAVVLILEAIYEQDFLPCSYGFRPGRSAHQALASLREQTMAMGGGWLVEVDIRRFFDTLDQAQLRELVKRRVRDGVLLRLIGKWLRAGVLEDGQVSYPESGSPQGGVVSPLLANIYLHYVMDVWFEQEVKPRLRGRAFLVRYADDLVMGFACEEDARRVLEVLPKRFGKYGLTLHPDKTRLVPFGRPAGRADDDQQSPTSRPGTFDFLGFTHYWGKSRRGWWVVKRQTAASRLRRTLGGLGAWCRRYRHRPLAEQHGTLSQKLTGHYGYFGITGNYRSLQCVYHGARLLWWKWLGRRSRSGRLSWSRYMAIWQRFPLPPPRIVHSVFLAAANP